MTDEELIDKWESGSDAILLRPDKARLIALARIGASVQPLRELYEADHNDVITITRTELGVLLGYHSAPPKQE